MSIFLCNICVRQGDNLSPLLFALFINDFSKYIEGIYRGLSINNCYPTLLDDDMLNMFLLLYADDTIVLTENACELQKALDTVHDYCGMYKFTVNINKTKMAILQLRAPVIIFILSYISTTNLTIKTTRSRSESLIFNVGQNYNKMNMPIDIKCNMFEKLVFPILLYGCEIWGFHCVNMLQTYYRKFLKNILHLRPSTLAVWFMTKLVNYRCR